ncbi:hypothetical protein B0H14DRAFT_3485547 [Mycena olivaceomarginata]|nr:hypothetical protein B0H14DRAFT_3485547 [Mycena olivaceomarginata]
MSTAALAAFHAVPPAFGDTLTAAERATVLHSFFYLDIASKGTKTPRQLQLRADLAVKAGKDLLVRFGTGSGKTLAMILGDLLKAEIFRQKLHFFDGIKDTGIRNAIYSDRPYYLRDLIDNEDIAIHSCQSGANPADLLTKTLPLDATIR